MVKLFYGPNHLNRTYGNVTYNSRYILNQNFFYDFYLDKNCCSFDSMGLSKAFMIFGFKKAQKSFPINHYSSKVQYVVLSKYLMTLPSPYSARDCWWCCLNPNLAFTFTKLLSLFSNNQVESAACTLYPDGRQHELPAMVNFSSVVPSTIYYYTLLDLLD